MPATLRGAAERGLVAASLLPRRTLLWPAGVLLLTCAATTFIDLCTRDERLEVLMANRDAALAGAPAEKNGDAELPFSFAELRTGKTQAALGRQAELQSTVRRELGTLSARLRLHLFGRFPKNHLVRGRDGETWFLHARLRTSPTFQPAVAALRARALAVVQQALRARGVRSCLILPPLKGEVLSAQLPEARDALSTAAHQLRTALVTKGVEHIDGSQLRARASPQDYWHRADTHWNDRATLHMAKLAARWAGVDPTANAYEIRPDGEVAEPCDLLVSGGFMVPTPPWPLHPEYRYTRLSVFTPEGARITRDQQRTAGDTAVAIVGTSFTDLGRLGHHLEGSLGLPVRNHAVKAQHGFRVLADLLSEPDFHAELPEILFFEIPTFELLADHFDPFALLKAIATLPGGEGHALARLPLRGPGAGLTNTAGAPHGATATLAPTLPEEGPVRLACRPLSFVHHTGSGELAWRLTAEAGHAAGRFGVSAPSVLPFSQAFSPKQTVSLLHILAPTPTGVPPLDLDRQLLPGLLSAELVLAGVGPAQPAALGPLRRDPTDLRLLRFRVRVGRESAGTLLLSALPAGIALRGVRLVAPGFRRDLFDGGRGGWLAAGMLAVPLPRNALRHEPNEELEIVLEARQAWPKATPRLDLHPVFHPRR